VNLDLGRGELRVPDRHLERTAVTEYDVVVLDRDLPGVAGTPAQTGRHR